MALARMDAEPQTIAVEIRQREAATLTASQACGIGRPESRPVCEVSRPGAQALQFLHAQPAG